MVTQRMRTDIWMCLFDLKRTVRYYEALATRYHRRHSLTLLFLAGGVGGSLTTALTDLIPTDLVPAVQSIAAALTAVVTAWVFIADYAAKAAVANMIHYQCVEVEADLSNLWVAVEDPSEADEAKTRQKFNALQTRLNAVTSRAGNGSCKSIKNSTSSARSSPKKLWWMNMPIEQSPPVPTNEESIPSRPGKVPPPRPPPPPPPSPPKP